MQIKPTTASDVQFAIDKIETDSFDHITLKGLLIDIRDYLPQNSPIKELSHFIAHPIRNKGIAFDHLDVFISNFLAVNKKGGSFNVSPVYRKEEIIESLIDSLKQLGFTINEAIFKAKEESLIESISMLIEDTVLAINNKSIIDARIIRSNGKLAFSFLVDPSENGRIIFRPNVSICIPFWNKE
jgi:DNA modification methylase